MGERIQPVPIDKVLFTLRDSDVADAKGCNILEKMGSLGRVGMYFVRFCLNDGADARDVIPVHGNPKPSIGRTPSSRADQEIFSVLIYDLLVDFTYI